MQRATRIAATVAAAIAGLARPASAQCIEGCPRDRERTVGMEISAHAGVGGFVNDTATAFTHEQRGEEHLFWPGFGAQLNLGFRFLPWMSVGLHGMYQHNPERDLLTGTLWSVAHTTSFGPYARFYLGPFIRGDLVDPWVGIGVDPFAMVQTRFGTPVGEQRTRIMAVGVPFSGGVDFNVLRGLSLGVAAQASPWIPYEICRERSTGAETCTNDNLAPNTYLYGGLSARYTFGR